MLKRLIGCVDNDVSFDGGDICLSDGHPQARLPRCVVEDVGALRRVGGSGRKFGGEVTRVESGVDRWWWHWD